MIRRVVPLLAVLTMLSLFVLPSTEAQSGPDGWTNYALNMRAGPGTTYAVITQLPSNTGMIFEARDATVEWLLGRTEDGAYRGWVASLYLRYREGFAAARLPVSAETFTVAAPAVADAPAVAAGSSAAQALMAIDILPTITPHARDIHFSGSTDPHSLLKVGDFNSENWEFLGPLGGGDYDLGPYSALQPTVEFFRGSFGATSITAHGGYTITAVLDPTWATTGQCLPHETPLDCELRRKNPAVAVMMFGSNDISHLSAAQFEGALRQVVSITLAHGTIPVLTTFPWCRTDSLNEFGLQLNLITATVAREYDVPLINFWRAAQALDHCGMADDTHLSKPVMVTTGYFTGEEQRTGYTLRNLLTLQTLDAIRAAALQ